jgi:hypothetical protein
MADRKTSQLNPATALDGTELLALVQAGEKMRAAVDTLPFVSPASLGSYAPLASPTFTGKPGAPTPAPTMNDVTIPTTAWVTAAISAAALHVAHRTHERSRRCRSGSSRSGRSSFMLTSVKPDPGRSGSTTVPEKSVDLGGLLIQKGCDALLGIEGRDGNEGVLHLVLPEPIGQRRARSP